MKPLYLLLASFLLLTACKKDEQGPGSSTGRVLDGVTQQPIAYADVFLLRKPHSGFAYHQVNYAKTDEEGKYKLNYAAENGYSYYLAATRYGYRDGSYQSIDKGKNITKNLYLEPKGWLRLTFVNAPPMDMVEYISVNGAYQPHYQVYDTIKIIVEGWGGRMTPVSYFMTRAGVKTNYQEEFFCAPHDTTTHYIYY